MNQFVRKFHQIDAKNFIFSAYPIFITFFRDFLIVMIHSRHFWTNVRIYIFIRKSLVTVSRRKDKEFIAVQTPGHEYVVRFCCLYLFLNACSIVSLEHNLQDLENITSAKKKWVFLKPHFMDSAITT